MGHSRYISYSHIRAVTRYIANQQRHHQTVTWEEEYRDFLKRHGLEFDERFDLD